MNRLTMVDATPFGHQLRTRRKALGWSTNTLALQASVSNQQVRNLEAGLSTRPHRSTVKMLEEALANGERRRATRAKAAGGVP